MAKTKYGITKSLPSLPARDLLRVPHEGEDLVVSSPAFGPSTYLNNLKQMSKAYLHSKELPTISFREPTTSESISSAAYYFKNIAKPQIFDPSWLQVGRIVRTSEGVFTNPPKNEQGAPITDEKILESFLNKAKKINGIYLCENNFGFAPYETFKQGVQKSGDFAESGLARVLEHTKEKIAKNLKKISSPELYKRGINVWSFDEVKEPVLRVASLGSDRERVGDRLDVDGDWGGDDVGNISFAFGVLKKTAEGDPQNSE